ncbi:coenzyme F420-0:L-glutamate ligase/coenzyme F420-1:gamma-L-glutamate ligase [Mumia flava]|uniref:Coenzyme F420-0:L-glutamate ligase/coenzyme F420-1:gamma-L-glutamate ligase n=1 Tax=Mumia flava TaxID=1348852 RepID=A0A0B2BI71_9ACTN|nr:coenzyme F420-0:L-glutamate ligase [Mumia flava]PJJ58527.1 coenzyme F420-0:L-glutamate ligase/coenzyme F420-1:gamma-L-glutamate ligase [Mumia flava]
MRFEVLGVDGVGEVRAGDDLVDLLLATGVELRDGDVVAVTSKVVSKALGLVSRAARESLVDAETVRVVARRGPTRIVRTRAGLTMAAAGVDASNTEPGTALVLPDDPDAEAARLRDRLVERTGRALAVVVTDTAGRAWRRGQTDIAIGAAGLTVLDDLAGSTDPYGNALQVTAAAVADEVAGAADLVAGKTGGVPFVVVRGLDPRWIGSATRAYDLVRPDDEDLFGWGARDAVEAALTGAGDGFGAPEPDGAARVVALAGGDADLVTVDAGALAPGSGGADDAPYDARRVVVRVRRADDPRAWAEAGRVAERLRIAAIAHRWAIEVVLAGDGPPPAP